MKKYISLMPAALLLVQLICRLYAQDIFVITKDYAPVKGADTVKCFVCSNHNPVIPLSPSSSYRQEE